MLQTVTVEVVMISVWSSSAFIPAHVEIRSLKSWTRSRFPYSREWNRSTLFPRTVNSSVEHVPWISPFKRHDGSSTSEVFSSFTNRSICTRFCSKRRLTEDLRGLCGKVRNRDMFGHGVGCAFLRIPLPLLQPHSLVQLGAFTAYLPPLKLSPLVAISWWPSDFSSPQSPSCFMQALMNRAYSDSTKWRRNIDAHAYSTLIWIQNRSTTSVRHIIPLRY